MDILIPTNRSDVSNQVAAIQYHTHPVHRIVTSQQPLSAAANRNWCLDRSEGEVLVMLDDDISGFSPGWLHALVAPLFDNPLVCMVSARLLTPDGRVAPTCSRCYDLTPEEIEVRPNDHCVLPSAAIAFRNIGLRFDEKFKGSGWEDNDFCFQYLQRNPWYKFIQSNRCRLIHANEQKRQSEFWDHNKDYFEWKWLRSRHSSPA